MKKVSKSFILYLFSIFSLILFTQVKWMYERDVYDHIAIRFVGIFLLTIPGSFLITLVSSFLVSLFKRGKDASDFIAAFYRPLMIFILSLIPLYEENLFIKDPSSTLLKILILGIVINLYLIRKLFLKSDQETVNFSYIKTVGSCIKWYGVELGLFLKAFSHISHFKIFKMPVTIYPLARFILLFQTIVVIKFSTASTASFGEFFFLIITTAISTILCVDLIMHISPKFVRVALSVLVALFYSFLSTYHFAQNTTLDFALFITNLDIIFYNESMDLAGDNLSPIVRNTIYLFLGAAILFQYLFGLFSPKVKNKHRKRVFLLKGIIYLFIVFLIPLNADEFSNFLNSVKNYQEEKKKIEQIAGSLTEDYPYVSESFSSSWNDSSNAKPNVIIVSLESYNGLMINDTTSEGVEITPFINSLKNEGLVIENYYGNSIQTSRGLFAMHSGILPSFRKKVMTNHDDLSIRSLPKILRNENYLTLFIKAYKSLSFDNNGPFMKHIGFEHVLAMTKDRITKEEDKYVWGWGLQDDIYYKKCLDIVDSLQRSSDDSVKKPFFLSLLTVSNHMKFNHLPNDKKFIYPNAKSADHRENLINSMHLTDIFLKNLFKELEDRRILENTVVIVTGDHSFPRGDYGIYNQSGFYEENFRTPMAIIWKGKIKPQLIKDVAYSHIDIAPTILDLLNINTKHNFIGESIFSTKPRKPVLLSQPYDGLYLASVKYPYKYVKCMSSKKEYLFDLSTKDCENNNLIKTDSLQEIISELNISLNDFYVNQTLIESNRIWPSDSSQLSLSKR